jgi:hypothetical protein
MTNSRYIERGMKRFLTFALLVFAGFSAEGDHLPSRLLAYGAPETSLAGIDLRNGDADEVLKRLGAPTQKVTVPNNPQWTGYLWDTPATRLEIEVTNGKGKNYLRRITLVRLGGGGSQVQLKESTGRGLKLDDTLETLKGIYGHRFLLSGQQPVAATVDPFREMPGVRTATLQWASLEFTLVAGLDVSGKIIALQLSPPECYPGGCR